MYHSCIPVRTFICSECYFTKRLRRKLSVVICPVRIYECVASRRPFLSVKARPFTQLASLSFSTPPPRVFSSRLARLASPRLSPLSSFSPLNCCSMPTRKVGNKQQTSKTYTVAKKYAPRGNVLRYSICRGVFTSALQPPYKAALATLSSFLTKCLSERHLSSR